MLSLISPLPPRRYFRAVLFSSAILLASLAPGQQTDPPMKKGTVPSTDSNVPAIPPSQAVDSDAILAQTMAEIQKARRTAPKVPRDRQAAFLSNGQIIASRNPDIGSTGSVRVTLKDGSLTHDAHIQTIDVYKPVWRGKDGTVEKNFRDSYKFNIAASRLAHLLDLDDMVPLSVEREYNGKMGSYTWWVDDVLMTELERRDKKVPPPTSQRWVDLLNIVKVFDQLIYNVDRNQGNLLILKDWTVAMIDHTRAFRVSHQLQNPKMLSRVDYKLLGNMRKLTLPLLTRDLGPFLRAEEIEAILARRDLIVSYFDKQVTSKGQDEVITGMPRATPRVAIP